MLVHLFPFRHLYTDGRAWSYDQYFLLGGLFLFGADFDNGLSGFTARTYNKIFSESICVSNIILD